MTPAHMPILVEFGWVGNSRKYVKYNLSVFFIVSFFVHMPRAKNREWICTINGSKRVKSSKDVPFGGLLLAM